MQPAGAGALMALLNERKLKLEAEGLFAPERKRPLPFMPRVVGVVTSPTGAVIRDIRHRIADRFPLHILVWPVRVQGETCGEEVAAAIHGFNAIEPGGPVPRPDVLIVARGGGSLEDLWGFNDEAVVRAAASSAIPLISAVGHETDWTLIDHAADRRAPTPTGAAEMAVPVRADLVAALAALDARASAAVSRTLQAERRAVANLARALPRPTSSCRCRAAGSTRRRRGSAGRCATTRPSAAAPWARPDRSCRPPAWKRRSATAAPTCAMPRAGSSMPCPPRSPAIAAGWNGSTRALRPHIVSARSDQARHRLAQAGERMDRAFRELTARRRNALSGAWRVAASLDPRQVLERGYAIVRGPDNVPITRADDLQPGMAFELEFARGHRRGAVAVATDGIEAARPQKSMRAKKAPAPPTRRATSSDPRQRPPSPPTTCDVMKT